MGTEEGFGEVVQYSFNTWKKSLAVLHSLTCVLFHSGYRGKDEEVFAQGLNMFVTYWFKLSWQFKDFANVVDNYLNRWRQKRKQWRK